MGQPFQAGVVHGPTFETIIIQPWDWEGTLLKFFRSAPRTTVPSDVKLPHAGVQFL